MPLKLEVCIDNLPDFASVTEIQEAIADMTQQWLERRYRSNSVNIAVCRVNITEAPRRFRNYIPLHLINKNHEEKCPQPCKNPECYYLGE